MSGWSISIYALTPAQLTHPDRNLKASILANWETRIHALEWLRTLVSEGKATEISSLGYPSVYTSQSAEILPLLNLGIFNVWDTPSLSKCHDQLTAYPETIQLHPERIATCLPEQVLTIEVWDLS